MSPFMKHDSQLKLEKYLWVNINKIEYLKVKNTEINVTVYDQKIYLQLYSFNLFQYFSNWQKNATSCLYRSMFTGSG